MKKKRAEQVLQTTVSLIQFKLQMSDYNINRNEKKCGVTSFMVCNQVHCLQPGSGYATRFGVCKQVWVVQPGLPGNQETKRLKCVNHINETVVCNTCSARFFFIPIDITVGHFYFEPVIHHYCDTAEQ